MSNKHQRFGGFTLSEILIAVTILAVLAALTLPRLSNQIDRAKTAEAFHVIDMIRQAAERRYDATGSYSVPSETIVSDGPGIWVGGSTGTWADLGLSIAPSRYWAFQYTGHGPAGYSLDARNWKGELHLEATQTLGRLWTCTGSFRLRDPANPSKGCTSHT